MINLEFQLKITYIEIMKLKNVIFKLKHYQQIII